MFATVQLFNMLDDLIPISNQVTPQCQATRRGLRFTDVPQGLLFGEVSPEEPELLLGIALAAEQLEITWSVGIKEVVKAGHGRLASPGLTGGLTVSTITIVTIP